MARSQGGRRSGRPCSRPWPSQSSWAPSRYARATSPGPSPCRAATRLRRTIATSRTDSASRQGLGPTGPSYPGLPGIGCFFAARRRREGDAFALERELHLFARLVDPPLHGRERDLERVGDLGVREADHVAEEQRHLEVDVELLDRPPDRVHRLDPLERRVEDLERRHVVEVDDRARTSLVGAELVEDPVLRHLEEPGREATAEREARQALVDAEEDLLRQVLGERSVSDEAEHVVVDRNLVGAQNQREGTLIAPLGLPQYAEIRLSQRQEA